MKDDYVAASAVRGFEEFEKASLARTFRRANLRRAVPSVPAVKAPPMTPQQGMSRAMTGIRQTMAAQPRQAAMGRAMAGATAGAVRSPAVQAAAAPQAAAAGVKRKVPVSGPQYTGSKPQSGAVRAVNASMRGVNWAGTNPGKAAAIGGGGAAVVGGGALVATNRRRGQ